MTAKPSAIIIVVLGIVAAAAAAMLRWYELPLSVPPTQLAALLSPLILVAAFIERAVEVFVSPMRDATTQALRKKLNTAELLDPADSAQVASAHALLSAYQNETKGWAMVATFLLGLIAAFAGVRCLGVFLPATLPANIPAGQMSFFRVLDVLLTAALLAGGAAGLHAPINAFTSFFNASANNNQNVQAQP